MLRALLLLTTFLTPLLVVGCGDGGPPATTPTVRDTPKEWTPLVSGDAILARVRTLCAIGPRAPGTAGIQKARDEIQLQLFQAGLRDVVEQRFTAKTPDPKALPDRQDPTDRAYPNRTEFVNIVARIPGKSPKGIAIGAHYDSKTFTDFEFVGANDAASAVGTVLELAAALQKQAATVGPAEDTLHFVFFDGEESIRESNDWVAPDHTYGSRHFVAQQRQMSGTPPTQVTALVLLDMMGGPDLLLADDANSDPALRQILKDVSREVFGFSLLTKTGWGTEIIDDHVEFQRAGIPAVNLIDAAFVTPPRPTWWHTAEDTVDRLSPKSLEKVATLVLAALPRLRAHPR